jgi:hypothetical protein
MEASQKTSSSQIQVYISVGKTPCIDVRSHMLLASLLCFVLRHLHAQYQSTFIS